MALPTSRDVHVDTLLTNVSIAYRNKNYIADQMFPLLPVMKRSDIVPKFDQSHWFRDQARLRAPGTRSARGGFSIDSTDTYYAKRYSFGVEIDDDTRDNADSVWALDENATNLATDMIQLRREVSLAGSHFTTGVWGNDDTGGVDFTVWSNYSTSSPLVNLSDYQDEVEGRIALEANSVAMGKQVWQKLKWHPDLLDSIKYTERGVITEQLFASLTGFSKVLIGRALYTTTAEGTAESSVAYSRVWGKNVLIYFAPDSPSLMTPSAGYCFTWQRVPSSIQYMVRHRDDEAEKDIFECNSYFVHKTTAARAGTFLSGAVA